MFLRRSQQLSDAFPGFLDDLMQVMYWYQSIESEYPERSEFPGVASAGPLGSGGSVFLA